MKKLALIILLFHFCISVGNSQNIGIQLQDFQGVWHNEASESFGGGFGLEANYEHSLKKGGLRTGLAFRAIDWGNQASLNIGYHAPYLIRDKWTFTALSSVGLGFALFRENPLFAWSLEYVPEFTLVGKKNIDFYLGIGIRYTNSPAYKDYGLINQVLEIPIRLGMRFDLKKE